MENDKSRGASFYPAYAFGIRRKYNSTVEKSTSDIEPILKTTEVNIPRPLHGRADVAFLIHLFNELSA